MHNRACTKFIKISLALFAIISTSAQAEFYDSRVEKWEFFLSPQLTSSKDLQFDNGAEADINQRSTLAFGMGYNIDAHIELSLQFSASNGNYTSTIVPNSTTTTATEPVTSTQSLYTSTMDFGFTYNFLSGPFTPYAQASLGWTYIDSGLYTGTITTGCWWYPYYGYVCGPVAQTYTSNEFIYGAALGLRYDFGRKMYIKGDVGKNYVDFGSSNTPDFDTYRFTFGFMF
jgi:hypothetical protein